MPTDPVVPQSPADVKAALEAVDAKLKRMEEKGLEDTKRYEETKARLDALQAKYDELTKKPVAPAADAGDEEEAADEDRKEVEDLEDEEDDFLP
jgi:hypothetical protein